MEHCYNVMASMDNKDNISIMLYMLGFGGLFMGVVYLSNNEVLTHVGYITTSILSCILVCMINRIHAVMSIQSSTDTLKLENDKLSRAINNLKKVEQEIKEDMSILKSTIVIVRENADDMIILKNT